MQFNRFDPCKILCHSEALEQIRRGEIPAPVQMIVYPSNLCNFACGHCIMQDERMNKAVLPQATMDKLVDICLTHSIKTVLFSGGGEPLTNAHTLRTIQTLKAFEIKTGLNTNGELLQGASGIDYLRVSVDAGTGETYRKVHRKDAWETVNENLRNLRVGSLGLAFLITRDNYHEIEQFCQWAQQFPYDFLHIRPAYIKAENDEIRRITESLSDVREKVAREYRNVHFRTDKFDGTWTERRFSKCHANPLIAVLAADGRFLICQDVFHLRFGDLNTQSFEECWWGDEHRRAMQSVNLDDCPRCVETGYNEIIEHCVINDELLKDLL